MSADRYYTDGRYVFERIAGGAGRRRIATFHDHDGE